MGSLGSPKLWVPYINNKDCSLGFCSLYCPQWCYLIYPPPPPLDLSGDDSSEKTFSPLVIAIIGILAGAFLLVSYYTVISKYCRNNNNNIEAQRRFENPNDYDENNQNPNDVAFTEGLDEASIKSIAVRKYKKGTTEYCSVCLGEFRENESLRLLPKCSHGFHVECIDTWLRSHSNCPLCRANVVAATEIIGSPVAGELLVMDDPSENYDINNNNDDVVHVLTPKRSNGIVNDSEESLSTRIEVRDLMRRSVSMDRVFVLDILSSNEEEEEEGEELDSRASCSKSDGSEDQSRRFTMKRSVSSGRFFLTRPLAGNGKGKMNNDLLV